MTAWAQYVQSAAQLVQRVLQPDLSVLVEGTLFAKYLGFLRPCLFPLVEQLLDFCLPGGDSDGGSGCLIGEDVDRVVRQHRLDAGGKRADLGGGPGHGTGVKREGCRGVVGVALMGSRALGQRLAAGFDLGDAAMPFGLQLLGVPDGCLFACGDRVGDRCCVCSSGAGPSAVGAARAAVAAVSRVMLLRRRSLRRFRRPEQRGLRRRAPRLHWSPVLFAVRCGALSRARTASSAAVISARASASRSTAVSRAVFARLSRSVAAASSAV